MRDGSGGSYPPTPLTVFCPLLKISSDEPCVKERNRFVLLLIWVLVGKGKWNQNNASPERVNNYLQKAFTSTLTLLLPWHYWVNISLGQF